MSIPTKRYRQLDGLRGWLSLMVVFSHIAAFRWVPLTPQHTAPDPLTWLGWNLGAPAVDAFFVMSGLVVGQSIAERPRPYFTYLNARARRLLPMGVCGLLLAAVIRVCGPHFPPGTLRDFVTTPLTLKDWAGVFTLGLVPYTADSLNPPLWSLVVEQHAALLMPALVTLSRSGAVNMALSVLGCLLLAIVLPGAAYSLWFVPAFLTGILIRQWRLPQAWCWPVFLAGLLLWQHRQFTGDSILYRQTAMLGAAMLVTALLSFDSRNAVRTFLTSRVSQWLGAVSYPLYASHFAVLSVAAALFPHHLMPGLFLSVPAALGLAYFLWRDFERPWQARWRVRDIREVSA